MSIDPVRINAAYAFFMDKGLSPDEIIRRGKARGLHVTLIERAMIVVSEAYDPEKDRARDLVWKVWATAHEIKTKLYHSGRDLWQKQQTELEGWRRMAYWLGGYSVFSTLAFIYSWVMR
jgi:hypothetical protein